MRFIVLIESGEQRLTEFGTSFSLLLNSDCDLCED